MDDKTLADRIEALEALICSLEEENETINTRERRKDKRIKELEAIYEAVKDLSNVCFGVDDAAYDKASTAIDDYEADSRLSEDT